MTDHHLNFPPIKTAPGIVSDGHHLTALINESLLFFNHTSISHNISTGDHNASFGGHHGGECTTENHVCMSGLILPIWEPNIDQVDILTRTYRAAVYLAALSYLLYGVNIVTDRLVSTIEVVISQKRSVTIKSPNGGTKIVKIPVWHPVVATLTVYVVGASASEIFLPTLEIIKRNFETDELGPSIIVGGGAYHLFLITGVCLGSVKETTAKPIEDLAVFFVTTAFAIIAYLWIYLIAEQISPGIVELWEAVVTLALFPTLVFFAWAAERRLLPIMFRRLFCRKTPTQLTDRDLGPGTITEPEGSNMVENERRRRLSEILKKLKAAHPEKTQFELEEMAQLKILESAPKGAAFYRMQAAKASAGGGAVISKDKIKKRLHQEQLESKGAHAHVTETDPHTQIVGFVEPRITCIESCGCVVLHVERLGAGIDETMLTVDYATVDGTAVIVSDYEETHGTLKFVHGQTTADISVNIVDDDEFEEDKEFSVRLSKPKIYFKQGEESRQQNERSSIVVPFSPGFANLPQLVNIKLKVPEVAVTILDDDHCGVFGFETSEQAIPDNIGTAKVKVVRSTGARGCVAVPFRAKAGTAMPNRDYVVPQDQTVIFENNQSEAFILIDIIDADRIGEMQTFFVELLPPIIRSQPPANPLGNPVLGTPVQIKLGICEDQELSEALDRLLKVGDMAELISSTTWADQFRDAISFSFESDIGDESEQASEAGTNDSGRKSSESGASNASTKSCIQARTNVIRVKTVILYLMALPWKLLAAALPPAHFFSGWLAFILLLLVMAAIAAIIGDLASHFGCTVGLKDSVTAVTLIAFGMGLPDMFASRHAALHEKTADAAIGHITGSNAVNVFLGIGLSWTVAAAHHTYYGEQYEVPAGGFGFIVTVYCCCACIGVLTLLLRRLPPIRGELGGPRVPKYISASLFILLWVTFIVLATLRSYCILPSF